jgi:hypothetical protein
VRVHRSALKHGVTPDDAIQAAAWPLWVEPLDDGPPAEMLRLGANSQARLLDGRLPTGPTPTETTTVESLIVA